MEKWQKKTRKKILDKKIFSIYDYECFHPVMAKDHTFSVIETHDWVNIVAETDDHMIIFIKQHRLGTDEISVEIPAGLVEPGEMPLDAAARELLEETGYEARTIRLMKKMAVNPAIMNNYVYFYHATGCRKTSSQNLDESEDIESFLVSRNNIHNMIKNDEITHQVICTALLLYDGGFSEPD